MRKSKKILSIVLSLIMVFSAFGAAFAASAADKTYTPSYDGTSKETVSQLIADAKTLIDTRLWEGLVNPMLNGGLIQTIYGLYPSLEGFKDIAGLGEFAFTKGSFYKSLNPALFAGLGDDEEISTQRLAAYFQENPVQADGDAFWTELAKALYPLGVSGMLGGNIAKLFIALDNLLVKLGLDVPHPSFDYLNVDEDGVPTISVSAKRATKIEASGDLSYALASLPEYGDFGNMTPAARGQAIANFFSDVKAVLNVKSTAQGTQTVPMVQNEKGKAVRPSGTMDYSAVNGATITVNVTDLFTGTTYEITFDNPYAGLGTVAVGATELNYADGAAADGAKLPAQINVWGEVCDSDGRVLYPGSSSPLSVSMDGDTVAADLVAYLQAILPVLQQDTLGTVIGAIRAFADPAARVAFYEFTQELQRSVGIMTALVAALGSIPVEGYNLGALMVSLQYFLNEIDDMTEEVTVNGETKTATDFTQALNYIGSTMNIVPAKNEDGSTKLDENNKIVLEPLGITFSKINWANLSTDMDDADTLMVVYNYLFSNLITNKGNWNAIETLLAGFDINLSSISGLLDQLDQNALLTFVGPLLHNIVYPAITDEASGVKIEVNDSFSTITPGAAIAYEALTSGESYDKLVEALKAGNVNYEKLFVFDLSLVKDNEDIQPDGTIQVSIPVPEGFDAAKCVIYRLEADGSMTKLDVTVEDGFLVFVTDHLSVYGIAQLKEAVSDNNESKDDEKKPDDGSIVDTGDVAIGAVTMIALAAGAAFVLSRKKKA